MILFGLLVFGITLMFIFKICKSKPTVFSEQEQFIYTEPVLYDLPKNTSKNSHWFTHTFMRARKKG